MSLGWNLQVSILCVILLAGVPIKAAEADLAELEERAIAAAVTAVAPSVVRIETIGGIEQLGGMLLGEGPTTGLIVAPEGWIISSAFNFIRQPASILVTLPDGQRAAARIVARDHSRMLVLLKADFPQPLPVPEAAPVGEMTVGQWSIAVGRSFDAKQPNVSVGVLSAKNRIWSRAIQTDAKVSPSNYGGPLIDIRGRVMGVLVPLAPDAQGEIAGAEWYDSGIGFAVPLADILARLPQLQAGRDLHPGLLGITLEGEDIYSSKPTLTAVQARSPAYEAGLRAGDTIVEVEGAPVASQVQLKHALGPRDAGDQVRLAATRGVERLEFTVPLVDKLVPYEHPFLGILPDRTAAGPGVLVRYVYLDSGASAAGIRVGDRLVLLDGKPIENAESLRLDLANRQLGQAVPVGLEREADKLSVQVKLGSLPTTIPDSLPAAKRDEKGEAAAGVETGMIEIKVPEEPNRCDGWVPEDYAANRRYGLLVQLPAPGDFDRPAFAEQWRSAAEEQELIVLAPQAAQPTGWQPTEIDFIRKAMEQALTHYSIDRSRIVVYGHQASGTMAFLVGFRFRDLIRGIAAMEAAPPSRVRLPDNDPVERLAIYLLVPTESKSLERIDAAAKALAEMKYPVTLKRVPAPPARFPMSNDPSCSAGSTRSTASDSLCVCRGSAMGFKSNAAEARKTQSIARHGEV